MNTVTTTPNTYTAIASKLGIGIEAAPGAAVKAARLLDRVSGNMDRELKRAARKAIRNHPGSVGDVLGASKFSGKHLFEVTPESCDELFSLYYGAPVTTTAAAGIPAAPAAPGVAVVGTPGAVNASYTVVAGNAQGDSAASAATVITTGNATLSGANYNQVTITPVPYATIYKILKGGALVGQTTGLTFQDTGQATSVYAAPAAATGNVQTWTNSAGPGLYGSLQELRGGQVFLYSGVQGTKMSLSYKRDAQEPLTLEADLMALYEATGYTQAQLGLDVAGFDPLGAYSQDANCVVQIAGAYADAQDWKMDLDRNLGEKRVLNSYTGASGFYPQGSKHSVTANLYFSTDGELQRFLGQSGAVGPYGQTRNILYFPAQITTTAPTNAAGIVNQLIVRLPYCDYQKVGEAIKGKDAIMQAVELYPHIDPVTGTDIIIQTVNSRTNGSIVNPGTPVTPVPGSAFHPYTN